MKKLIVSVLLLTMLSGSVLAENYKNSADVSIVVNNRTEAYTISKGDTEFTVNFYIEEKQPVFYEIDYTIDGKSINCGKIEVTPYKEVKKTVEFDAPYGLHTLTVNVKRDGKVVESFTDDRIAVAERYEPQFMDDFNRVGVNTHFAHYAAPADDTLPERRKAYNLRVFDYLEYAGVQTIRDGNQNPNYYTMADGYDLMGANYRYNTRWWLDPLMKTDTKVFHTVMGTNATHKPFQNYPDDAETSGTAPRLPETIKGYADAVSEILKQLPVTKEFGVWNEPNISSQWTPQDGHSSSDYSNLLKQTAVRINQEHPQKDLVAFTVANMEVDWMKRAFDEGIYPYLQGIDHHRYGQHSEPESETFREDYQEMEELSLEYGGWLIKTASELGASVGGQRTEDDCARRPLKEFLMLDEQNFRHTYIYDFVNDGVAPTDGEDNFGLMTQDKKPKKGYLSYIRYNQELAGSVYVGMLDLGIEDTHAYMYLVDNKPKLVAWKYSKDTKGTARLEAEKITARDMYGNTICENADSVTLVYEPIYIDGLDEEWVARTVHDATAKKHAEWLENYSEILPETELNNAIALFEKTENSFKSAITAEETELLMDEYTALGKEILLLGKKAEIKELDVSKMLYQLYRILMPIDGYYIMQYDGKAVTDANCAKMLDFVNEKYRDDVKMLQYSDKMYRIGENYCLMIDDILNMPENPMKNGVITGYNKLAKILFDWVIDFAAYETLLDYGLTIQIPGYDLNAFVNQRKNVRLALRNQGTEDFSGKLVVYDEEGNAVHQLQNLKLKVGETKKAPFVLHIPESDKEDGSLIYTYSLIDDSGKVRLSHPYKVIAQKSIEAKVLTATEAVSELENIKLEIQNLRNQKIEFNLEVYSEGELKLGQKNIKVTMEPKEKKVISIPVSYIENNKFHFYPISYKAVDTEGFTIAQADTLLNFSCITKADKVMSIDDFDGSIDDWYDAYPIYLNTPDNAKSNAEWKASDLSVRMFFKWDEEHLYVLADVYDDIQLQNYVGTNLWQGDSLQLGIDALNEDMYYKTTVNEVYEVGIGLNESGVSFHHWYGKPDYSDYLDWCKIIRDDENHTTRYLLCIPNKAFPLLKLENGSRFGFNFAINDADILARDNFLEFGHAIASDKDSTNWDDFVLLAPTNEEYKEGLAADTFN